MLSHINESEQKMNDEVTKSASKTISLTDKVIKQFVQSADQTIKEFGISMQQSPIGKMIPYVTPLHKLIQIMNFKDDYHELKERGHSSVAAFMGSGASRIANSVAITNGVAMTVTGLSPQTKALSSLFSLTGGVVLMHESGEIAKLAKYQTAIIVDRTLDTFTDLYTSAVQFLTQSYQKYKERTSHHDKKYEDIESAMLDLDYKIHTKELSRYLDQDQQLLYGAVTRELFNSYFSLNKDKRLKLEIQSLPTRYDKLKKEIKPESVKDDINKVKEKLREPKNQIHTVLRENNKNLQVCLNLSNSSSDEKKKPISKESHPIQPLREPERFCEILYASSQMVAFVSRILHGGDRFAHQVLQSSAGVSQLVMGMAQIVKTGWAAGPIGMIFSGMNLLVSSFGSEDDSSREALAQQLMILSQQISALHQDMLMQFGKVFTALGIINTNIIQGFQQLHEDQVHLLVNIKKLQTNISCVQNSINALGSKVDQLSNDLQGYILADDRKQLQFVLSEVREKSKRPFQRLELHPHAMAAFRTFNEDLVTKQLSDRKSSNLEIVKSLTTKLGSAEANIGLLLCYAREVFQLELKQPIADPLQWQQTADLLIELVEKNSEEKHDMKMIGEQDYKDFEYLKQIGENWLYIINQFKSPESADGKRHSKLADLFKYYRDRVSDLITLIEKEVARFEVETKESLMPKFKGYDEWKKQHNFVFTFKRNYAYLTATEDWSSCKGFHNAARFVGYDNCVSEWAQHVEQRKEEITKKLTSYKLEIDFLSHQYKTQPPRVFLFEHNDPELIQKHFSSAFMIHETDSNSMPLLPLPYRIQTSSQQDLSLSIPIPKDWIIAEIWGIGYIKHTYKIESKQLIYKIHFESSEDGNIVLLYQYNLPCTLADHLDLHEAIWHAYMGGYYPQNGSYTSLQLRSTYTPNNDYFVYHYCALPLLSSQIGLRQSSTLGTEKSISEPSSDGKEMVLKKVKKKLTELRQNINEKILQEFESLDSRNVFANALLEVDASAKILIAFLSLVFRDHFTRPAAIWTRDEIIGFIKGYQSQDVYLSHQLKTNLLVLDVIENQFKSQKEIAYTPVQNTLKKLDHFMKMYETHILKDSELLARENTELRKDAVMYGAAQATLLVQTELLNSGHTEAALHVSKMLASCGIQQIPYLLSHVSGDLRNKTTEDDNKRLE